MRRIKSGGPLKHEPGPWDLEWCIEQAKIDGIQPFAHLLKGRSHP
jgi:hypothetical protein